MSDLIEKVAVAIRPTLWDSRDAARAAILAVAEWLAETEERECYPLETLRAELERLRGDK